MKIFNLILFVFFCCVGFSQDLAQSYIDQYKTVAIEEMHRTGIPASIKLAQGLLESDWGRSNLAIEANNHFGIKCGSNWDGEEFYKIDDDRDRFGRIVESCFREYESAEESYMAHSEFLVQQENRYGFLFEYKTTNYKAWARGLRKAGYATDPAYPRKLIDIIEKHELYRYDVNIANDIAQNNEKYQQNGYPSLKQDGIDVLDSKGNSGINYSYNNEVRMHLANGNQTLKDISRKYRIPLEELLKYNDHLYESEELILANRRIYLERKKLQYDGRNKFHEVRPGDSMVEISQHYGIQKDALYARNRMPLHAEILPGELIQLKGIRTAKKPRYKANVYEDSYIKKADKMFTYLFLEEGYEQSK